jgi:hypothetical protein
LCVNTWGEEGFHEKSPTRVCDERSLELGESLCFAIYSASHAFSPFSSSLTRAAGCASMRKIPSARWIRAISPQE